MRRRRVRSPETPPTAPLLLGAGLRKTSARDKVLQVLVDAGRPLSHQEITSDQRAGALDRVTLYRTLATLCTAGLLHRVHGGDGIWRFSRHAAESGTCRGNHLHFLCVACHEMSCLPEQPLPWVEAPAGAEILGKQLVVYGRCARCAARPRRSAPRRRHHDGPA